MWSLKVYTVFSVLLVVFVIKQIDTNKRKHPTN
jgi:hypothetical protein